MGPKALVTGVLIPTIKACGAFIVAFKTPSIRGQRPLIVKVLILTIKGHGPLILVFKTYVISF